MHEYILSCVFAITLHSSLFVIRLFRKAQQTTEQIEESTGKLVSDDIWEGVI